MPTMPFKRVFIANRGEICRRIAQTARALGMETVCLTGQSPPPLFLAAVIDRFINVVDESPALYLNAARMVALARESGCDAVHPGFGFLSENAGFAAAVQEAGLCWIGPSPASIRAMADKGEARTTAERIGLPCTRGLAGVKLAGDGTHALADVEAFAEKVGYPLLIKAALGGGGKGMRLVRERAGLDDALTKAYSEALNSFGDGTLLVEQYIESARHVEVQILADQHGQVFAMGDRDCSLQRRHQKVLEEAPAPYLGEATRRELHACAIRLAKEVGYYSTGTVEFLVDWNPATRQAERQPFFFLEMNTRLQVEHPVTEEVFQIDLVAWQFRVAAGERLSAELGTRSPRGHSIEARLYAEDIHNNFFPAPGPVYSFQPYEAPGVRWELGLDPVDSISSRFDPMIAKVVATAETRPLALARLADCLGKTLFYGPANNKDFVGLILTATNFAQEACDTHFIGQELAKLTACLAKERASHAAEGERLVRSLVSQAADLGGPSLRGEADVASVTNRAFVRNKPTRAVGTLPVSEGDALAIVASADVQRLPDFLTGLRVGKAMRLHKGRSELVPFMIAKDGRATVFTVLWQRYEYTFIKEKRGWQNEEQAAVQEGALAAPVPGKVIRIHVQVDELVEPGTALFVLESMKMEFDVRAPSRAKVIAIHVKPGQQVGASEVLAILEGL